MFRVDGQCFGSCLWETTYLCFWIPTVGGGEYLGCCGYDCLVLTGSNVFSQGLQQSFGREDNARVRDWPV